jgi:hypothetical protein
MSGFGGGFNPRRLRLEFGGLLYIAELRSRDLKIPEEEVLGANLDALTGNYVTAVRLIGRSVADLWKLLRPPR